MRSPARSWCPTARCARGRASSERVKAATLESDESLEACEQRGVALGAERYDEVSFVALGPTRDLMGAPHSLAGGVDGPPAGVSRVPAGLTQARVEEGLCDTLNVHRVGPERPGELADALTGLGGDEP